ncbi:MAG TPA: hypothetical protein ENN11_04550 [Methanomicrobia archaeon]|nr:hypothetical protein [Methanomicrobia archaeon]
MRENPLKTLMQRLDFSAGTWIPIALIAIVAMLAYYVRPWFHGLVMAFYKSPLTLFLIAIIVVLFIAYTLIKARALEWQYKDTTRFKRYQTYLSLVMVIGIVAVVCIIPLYMYSGYYMDRSLYENTNYVDIDAMPETETIRFLPLSIAQRYSLDVFADPQYTLGDGDLVKEQERLYWKFPIVPEGALLYYTKKPQGVISVAADTSAKETTATMEEMEIGENIGITDNISWRIYKEDMFCDIADVYYQDDLIIVSVIKYNFKLIGRYPYFGGVYTIDFDGNVTYYSPEEAAEQPWGNRVYPESLARKQVEVVNTKNGLLNMWVYHEEMLEIQDVYSGGNQQPFMLDTDEGLVWMTAVEPRGKSYGLYRIFFQDAMTGDIYTYSISGDSLTGPRYSVDYVKKTFPNFDWNSFFISEPRPIIKEGTLYWLVSVVHADSAGVTKQCVVNAKTSDVIAFDTDQQVREFFRGEQTAPPTPPDDQTIEQIRQKIDEVESLLDELKSLLEQLESEENG